LSIVGIGTDIVAVERVAGLLARHGDRFIARCFRDNERRLFASHAEGDLAAKIAGRWAAKEAFLKALGGRISHIPYRDVSVAAGADGEPVLAVAGKAERALAQRGGARVFLTISHERRYAVATVLIERG